MYSIPAEQTQGIISFIFSALLSQGEGQTSNFWGINMEKKKLISKRNTVYTLPVASFTNCLKSYFLPPWENDTEIQLYLRV